MPTPKWMPIETAPRNGTRILLYREGYAEPYTVGYWCSSDECWCIAISGMPFIGTVLHWQQLPLKPR